MRKIYVTVNCNILYCVRPLHIFPHFSSLCVCQTAKQTLTYAWPRPIIKIIPQAIITYRLCFRYKSATVIFYLPLCPIYLPFEYNWITNHTQWSEAYTVPKVFTLYIDAHIQSSTLCGICVGKMYTHAVSVSSLVCTSTPNPLFRRRRCTDGLLRSLWKQCLPGGGALRGQEKGMPWAYITGHVEYHSPVRYVPHQMIVSNNAAAHCNSNRRALSF